MSESKVYLSNNETVEQVAGYEELALTPGEFSGTDRSGKAEALHLAAAAFLQIRLLTGRYGRKSDRPIPADAAELIFELSEAAHNIPDYELSGVPLGDTLARTRDAIERAKKFNRLNG